MGEKAMTSPSSDESELEEDELLPLDSLLLTALP
jgi:hypothetical protein